MARDETQVPAGANNCGCGADTPRRTDRTKRAGIQAWRIGALIVLNTLIAAHLIASKLGWTNQGHTSPLDIVSFFSKGTVTIGVVLVFLWIAMVPIFGRVLCGWFCHMGAWQELGSKIMSGIPFLGRRPMIRSRVLRWTGPALLIMALVLLYLQEIATVSDGPAGLHFGNNAHMPVWEVPSALKSILILVTFTFLVNGVFGSRALCRLGCPFSYFFRPLQAFSLFRIRKTGECIECRRCSETCLMGIDVMHQIQTRGNVPDVDCVRCMTCISTCPTDALSYTWRTRASTTPTAAAASHLRLTLGTELILLPLSLFAFIAGLRGVIWGLAFMISVGAIGLAVARFLWARFRGDSGTPMGFLTEVPETPGARKGRRLGTRRADPAPSSTPAGPLSASLANSGVPAIPLASSRDGDCPGTRMASVRAGELGPERQCL